MFNIGTNTNINARRYPNAKMKDTNVLTIPVELPTIRPSILINRIPIIKS